MPLRLHHRAKTVSTGQGRGVSVRCHLDDNLDDRDRDGQDQVGVADPVRDHLGVVDGREHRSH
jgi:hypothetical protein